MTTASITKTESHNRPARRGASVSAREDKGLSVIVLATLPPPVTGMTLVTQKVVDALRSEASIRVYNWSDGKNTRGWRKRASRTVRSVISIWHMIRWRWRSARTLYTVLNSRGGLYSSLLIIAAAKLIGMRCVVHHHVFAYIHQWDWRVWVITKLMGTSGTHIVLGPEMEREFGRRYGGNCHVKQLPNTFMMPDEGPSDIDCPADSSFRLGHMSNLTLEKGLGRVISTFERLQEQSSDVSLVLAGPIMGREEENLIRDAQQQFGDKVKYLGPVYGSEKSRFFEQIDVFLFPTRYRNEAQPLVLLEAFAFEKPVIALGCGCIPSMVGSSGGRVVDFDGDFVSEAAEQIENWTCDPKSYRQQAASVSGWAATLRADANANLQDFVDFVFENETRNEDI